jgi:ATP-dependent RNA helicase DeaD
MIRYNIDVGRTHGVMPKDIVGAIANEGGLSARQIGGIKLFDTFSTVELPAGLSGDVVRLLQKTWVRGQKLNLQPADDFKRSEKPKSVKKKVEGLVLPKAKKRPKPGSAPE